MEADWSKGGTLPPAAPGQKPVADVNYDPKAGGARNQRMINKAEAAIIFDGGSGTKDFTERAQEEQQNVEKGRKKKTRHTKKNKKQKLKLNFTE